MGKDLGYNVEAVREVDQMIKDLDYHRAEMVDLHALCCSTDRFLDIMRWASKTNRIEKKMQNSFIIKHCEYTIMVLHAPPPGMGEDGTKSFIGVPIVKDYSKPPIKLTDET